jgi:hypothetical protein
MQTKSFDLFADCFQFYLWDEVVSPEAPTDYSEEDVARRIKAAPHVVVIQPIRNMTVPVTIEIHSEEPSFNADRWDHIAECSLALPSGKLQVHECTGGSAAQFALDPGTYRVRAFFGGLDSLDASGLEGNDHYSVILWPAPAADLIVLKQWRGTSE